MTKYELTVVERAILHALNVGAPGLSGAIKKCSHQHGC
jgi:hypothetical protein